MLVNHSHILEVRELKDHKVILCYIQIAKRPIQYFHGQTTPYETNRWMQAEDWAKFEAHLEMMFDNQVAENRPDKIREYTFQLDASIRVRVAKCRIPVDALKRCILNASTKTEDALFAFEFFIEFKEPELVKECLSNLVEVKVECEEEDNSYEYEPQFITNQQDGAHVPYTPSPKTKSKSNCNKDEDILERQDDIYTPRPVDSSPKNNNENSPEIPAYKPSRRVCETRSKSMETQDNTKTKKEKKYHDDKKEIHPNKEREKCKQKKLNFDEKSRDDKKHQSKHKLGRDERKISSRHEDVKLNGDGKYNKNHKEDQLNDMKIANMLRDIDDSTDNIEAITSSPTHQEERKQNVVKNREDLCSPQPRRSSRSPIKPKRFIDETQYNVEVHTKRSTSRSPKRSKIHGNKVKEDLFGSADDDKDENSDFAFKKKLTITKSSHPKTLRENTQAESAKKKRKHSSPQDCVSEMKRMDNWLSKKSTKKDNATTVRIISSKHRDTKPSSTSSASSLSKRKPSNDTSQFLLGSSAASLSAAYLSKEAIEENILKEKVQLEKNSKIKEMLQEMAGPTPEKVETLNIKDLSLQDILNSFDQYKPQLDEIFRRSKKKSQPIKGYGGINNYTVMSLIDKNKPLDMMNKLQDAYEPDCEGIPTYTNIFANAMMPEWIIRLFMDKHKLTRDEAIKHVQAQEEYELHLKSLVENPIAE